MNRQTQAARSILRWPKRADSGQSAEIDWERIMVQITFAFVIILGYLVSVGVDEATDLAAEAEQRAAEAKRLADEMELQKQHSKRLQKVVGELKDTDVGKAIAGRVAAEKDSQLQTLLRFWETIRDHRRLYELLRHFDANAKLVPLAEDEFCMPKGDAFRDLNREIKRVFVEGNRDVNPTEIRGLTQQVLERAGFDPQAIPREFDPFQLSPDVAALYFDKSLPTYENFVELTRQILSDLRNERAQVVNLQYTLVGRIAAARHDWLAKQPLPQDVDVQTNDTDLGLRMLEEVFKDLRKREMELLPETADRIRKGSSTDQAKDTSQE